MIEHMNSINAYYAQLAALLDLMMTSENSVDIQSIKTASEMCTTMLNDMKAEIDQIEIEWQRGKGTEVDCCETCKYVLYPEKEEPCVNCRGNYISKWRAKA